MTTLIFEDDGWQVVTSGWTVASKHKTGIIICYPWSGMSGISMWGDAATGVARIEFDDLSIEQFTNLCKRSSGIVDLRGKT